MLESINNNLEWLSSTIKKYGVIICLSIGIYWILRRIWFWTVLPILLHGVLIFIGTISSVTYLTVPIFSVITTWIFVFSFGSYLFKSKKDA